MTPAELRLMLASAKAMRDLVAATCDYADIGERVAPLLLDLWEAAESRDGTRLQLDRLTVRSTQDFVGRARLRDAMDAANARYAAAIRALEEHKL